MINECEIARQSVIIRAMVKGTDHIDAIPALVKVYDRWYPSPMWSKIAAIDYTKGVAAIERWAKGVAANYFDNFTTTHLVTFRIVTPNINVRKLSVYAVWKGYNCWVDLGRQYIPCAPLTAVARINKMDTMDRNPEEHETIAYDPFTSDVALLSLYTALTSQSAAMKALCSAPGSHFVRLVPGVIAESEYLGVLQDGEFLISDQWIVPPE